MSHVHKAGDMGDVTRCLSPCHILRMQKAKFQVELEMQMTLHRFI